MNDSQYCMFLSLMAFCTLALGAEGSMRKIMRGVLYGMWLGMLLVALWLNLKREWHWPG